MNKLNKFKRITLISLCSLLLFYLGTNANAAKNIVSYNGSPGKTSNLNYLSEKQLNNDNFKSDEINSGQKLTIPKSNENATKATAPSPLVSKSTADKALTNSTSGKSAIKSTTSKSLTNKSTTNSTDKSTINSPTEKSSTNSSKAKTTGKAAKEKSASTSSSSKTTAKITTGTSKANNSGSASTSPSTSTTENTTAVIPYTNSDLDLLARLIEAEAGGEGYNVKLAVGAVVINRVQSKEWAPTISDVIYQKFDSYYQFTPVQNGTINNPASADSIKAAKEALTGKDPSQGAIYYFDNSTTNEWIRSKEITVHLGNMIFAK